MSPPLSWSFPFTFSNRKRVYGWNQLDENRISLWNLCPSPYPNQAELITLPCFHCVKNQITSVVQSCLTLCDPMNCSTPGLPVPHQLPEFTQTHVHRVSDAIQPSQPLSSPSSPALTAPPSMGFSRQEYWSGLPFPSPGSPALQADALTSEPPGKPDYNLRHSSNTEVHWPALTVS